MRNYFLCYALIWCAKVSCYLSFKLQGKDFRNNLRMGTINVSVNNYLNVILLALRELVEQHFINLHLLSSFDSTLIFTHFSIYSLYQPSSPHLTARHARSGLHGR